MNELAKLADNPTQLTDAAMALAVQRNGNKQIEDDINRMLEHDEELKASAPTFVPRKSLSPVVAEFHPTGSPEVGLRQVQSAPRPLKSHMHSTKAYEEKEEGVNRQVQSDEKEEGAVMQNEDSFFWSVAYEVE